MNITRAPPYGGEQISGVCFLSFIHSLVGGQQAKTLRQLDTYTDIFSTH